MYIQCIYVHKREEARIQQYYVQRGGDIGRGDKGKGGGEHLECLGRFITSFLFLIQKGGGAHNLHYSSHHWIR